MTIITVLKTKPLKESGSFMEKFKTIILEIKFEGIAY